MHVLNKTIVLTGAGSGIGRAVTLALLARGAQVAAVDIHETELQETQKLAGDKGRNVSIYVLNIADQAAVEALPTKIIAAHGVVDGLINNAGIIQPFVRVNDLDYSAITKVMNVNFFGTLYMTKAFLPLLLQRPAAHIVNISSMGGFLPVPGQSVYGASKAAVKLLTEGLSSELASTNVRVTVVFPGAIQTNITTNSEVQLPEKLKHSTSAQSIKALPATEAAEIIVRGMENNKPRVFVGKDARLMDMLYRLNPTFATNLITKQMKSLLS